MPYTPVPFPAAVVNPAVGGAGVPIAYVSNSQFGFAATAMDVSSLVPGGTEDQQERSLANRLAVASAWADRYCFGTDPAAKGSSLAATVSVESARIECYGTEFRLVCDYKPIVAVLGVDVGWNPQNVQSIGSSAQLRFGRRTIYIPAAAVSPAGRQFPQVAPAPLYAVWSYVNGYPHTSLAASAAPGDTTLTVTPTDGAGGVLGVYPSTRLTIVDGEYTEQVTVSAVSGTTLTVGPLAYSHSVPLTPDFIPVTAMPAEVSQAVIFLTSALIKTRGDNSMVLASLTEPHEVQASSGDEFTDVSLAKQLLNPFRVRVKVGR